MAAELHKHLRKAEYVVKTLIVQVETRGKGSSSTPGWTPLAPEPRNSPPAAQPAARGMTKSHTAP